MENKKCSLDLNEIINKAAARKTRVLNSLVEELKKNGNAVCVLELDEEMKMYIRSQVGEPLTFVKNDDNSMRVNVDHSFPSAETFKRKYLKKRKETFVPIIEEIDIKLFPLFKKKFSCWLDECDDLEKYFTVELTTPYDGESKNNVEKYVEKNVRGWFESKGYKLEDISIRYCTLYINATSCCMYARIKLSKEDLTSDEIENIMDEKMDEKSVDVVDVVEENIIPEIKNVKKGWFS